jgi:hypothetical protein
MMPKYLSKYYSNPQSASIQPLLYHHAHLSLQHMTHEQKAQIAQALQRYCSRYESIAHAAGTLKGIGTASITRILNNEWNQTGPRKWQELAKQVGFYTPQQETSSADKHTLLRLLFGDARRNALTYIITPADITDYTATTTSPDNDFIHTIHCNETDDAKALLAQIAGSLQLPAAGSIQQKMQDINYALLQEEEPMLILYHTECMSTTALHVWVALYALIAKHCGIVMMTDETWLQRIAQGVQEQKKGFATLHTGIDNRCYNLAEPEDLRCYAPKDITTPVTRTRRTHMRRHTAALLRHYNDAA